MEDLFGADAPPAAVPPTTTTEDGGFTLLGDAGETPAATGDAAFVGDVQEPPADDAMGFAAPPPETGAGDDAFFGSPPPPPAETEDAPIILAPPPPVEDSDAPIVLGPPPVEDSPAPGAAVIVDDAADEEPPPAPAGPSHMQKFNDEFQQKLKERMAEEDSAKVAMEAAAKTAIEEFTAKREAMLEARLAKNREDEQAKLEDIEADLENDNSWQRVNKLVDMTQDGGDDTTRMRQVFILLKNEDGLSAKVGA